MDQRGQRIAGQWAICRLTQDIPLAPGLFIFYGIVIFKECQLLAIQVGIKDAGSAYVGAHLDDGHIKSAGGASLVENDQILARLGPSPLAEDQLIRDLDSPAHQVAPALLTLELEGRILRQPGGLLARAT